MNLIHRHIFLNVMVTCALAVAMFAAVLMAGNALRELIAPALSGQLPLDLLLRLLGLMVPVVATYALPMGMLSGILLVLGRMSSDREIVALRAAGLSVAWMSTPIIFLALLGVVTSLAVNFQFMPTAKVAYETELRSLARRNPVSFLLPQTFIRDFPGVVLYVGGMKDERLQNFWLWEVDPQSRVLRSIHAEEGTVRYRDDLGTLELTLNHASAETRDAKDPEDFRQPPSIATWETATFELPVGKASGSVTFNKKLQWLTFDQLMAERARLDHPGPGVSRADARAQQIRVQMVIQEKFATAFSVLSFALVAIPLGIKVSRRESTANFGLGLMLAMAYYFITVVVGWADRQPWLRPDLLMWLPNLGFQALGFWLFFRLDRSMPGTVARPTTR